MNRRFIFLCLFLLSISVGCDRIRGFLGMATSSDIEKAREELEIRHDRRQRLLDSIEALKLRDTVSLPAAVPVTDGGLDKEYYVIVGSFKKTYNTKSMMSFLREESYEPVVIPLKNGYEMVALCGYDSYLQASREIDRIEQTEVCPYDVWIYYTGQRLHKE